MVEKAEPRIDFFQDGAPECPILQLSGTGTELTTALADKIRSLGEGDIHQFALQQLIGFENCPGPAFYCRASNVDTGITNLEIDDAFACSLTRERWSQIFEWLRPFCSRSYKASAYQWLDESSDIAWLFSPNGGW